LQVADALLFRFIEAPTLHVAVEAILDVAE